MMAVAPDAVRFVSNDSEAPLYVHADHLGTPQKMTDAAGDLAWNRVALPFGETWSEAGPKATALRFPGQLYDSETGLHYNYFRDYDPTTGRYVQSDPIGLAGGLNTYAYVGGNPVRFTDSTGEAIDTLADLGFIFYDLYRIARDNIFDNCGNLNENLLALGGDIVGAVIPGLTGVGLVVRNISKSNSPIWKNLKAWRGQTKTNGQSGRKREYYEWDHQHSDIERYNSRGDHMGSMDPVSGKPTKGPVEGRDIRDKIR